ncbi:MAG: sensor domain-containing protein [Thermoleophilaceae bacterium]
MMRPRGSAKTRLTSDGPGGVVIRGLLPTVTAVLLMLGFLRWQGERQGLYGTEVGVLLLTLGTIGITGGLLWYFARWLDRNESARRAVEQELRRSSRYFELSRDLACTAGLDGFFKQLNAAWTETLGWSEAELRSRPFVEFVHPDDREITERETAGLAGDGVTVDFVNRYATKDGGWRWLDWKAIAVLEDGLIYASARDVTQRRASEGALEASERRTRQIVETAHDAFIAIDDRGLITNCNPQAEATFGWAREEMLGAELAELIIPEGYREAHRRGIAHFLASGEGPVLGKRLELTALHRDGQEFPVELTISALQTQEGYSFNAFLRDITERKSAEELVERQRRQLLEAQSVGEFGSWEWDIAADSIEWSPELFRIYGIEPRQAPISFEDFLGGVHPDDRAAAQTVLSTAFESGESFSFEHRIIRPDGGVRVSHSRGEVIMGDDRTPVRMLGTGQDVTERVLMEQALREAEQRFRTAFDGAPIGVCLMSLDAADPGRLLQANPALAETLGMPVEDLTGVPISSLTHPEDQADLQARLAELVDGHSSHIEVEKRFMHRMGHPVWALISAAPLPAAGGQPAVAVTHVVDISDRKRFEGQLQHLADHDALTGLFNRRRFSEELEGALMRARRFGEDGAVLFLDLDGFKFVNDSLGHAAGDELIARVAGLLASALRETDTLARVGGDEFGVLLARCDQASAVLVADKLLSTLRRGGASVRDDGSARVSSSIGIALFNGEDGLTADELLVEADIAMYDAKEAGKDRHAIYERTNGRRELMSIRENWNERLRTAVEDDRFVLHAQPIMPICSNGTPTFELLLRLPDDHGDLIPPGTFLYNAERFGLIEQIDRWVLRQAVRHLGASHAAGVDLMLTVNVSGKTMGDPALGGYVAGLLAEHPVRSQRLVIEITETAAITNIERARTLATELQSLGCQIALDDFGAGFASFYYLKHLKFDYLKIDGEFISNLCTTPTDQLVVQAVVSIARGLNARTIAEFVGDDATVELLHKLGVDHGQGYHLGRPAALDQRLPHLIGSRSSV